MDKVIMLGDSIIVRVKSFSTFALALAMAILAHSDKLHFGERWNDLIILVCIAFIAASNPPVSKYQQRS